MDKKIDIVGAGPAGMVAAINLARAGFEVTVYEQHPDVGHRFHGDFQGLENWTTECDVKEELFNMGVNVNFLAHPFYSGDVYDPDLKKLEIKSDRPFFYIVKRGAEEESLDQGLKEQAIRAGVSFRFDHEIKKLKGRAIVGTGPKAADAIAVGLIFDTGHEDMAALIFDNDIAPDGYGYLLIHNGRGTIASCMFSNFRREKECVKKTIDRFRKIYSIDMRNEREFGGFGNFFLRDSAVRNGKLYVGENAGFQDFLWGFGMRYAMTSGYLAARSIINDSDYDFLWKQVLYPRMMTSLSNHYLLTKTGNNGFRWLVRLARRKGDAWAFLHEHYNSSFLKRLVFPLALRGHKSRVKDRSCSHENCSCIWCRCGEKEANKLIC